MNNYTPREGAHDPKQEEIVSARFETREYIEDLAVRALRIDADTAQATITRVTRQERSVRRDLDRVKQELSDECVRHENTRGALREHRARLETEKESLCAEIEVLRRLSALAIAIAWIGTALVALGVNMLTSTDGSKIPGLALFAAGAGLEIAAFLIRRHPSTATAVR